MRVSSIVGSQYQTASAGPGTEVPLRLSNQAALICAEGHGRYYEQAYRRQLFHAAIAGQVTSAALATAYTGLCISNPVGSSVNVELLKVGYAFTVIFPAVASLGLMIGYNSGTNVTHSVVVTPRSNFIGVGASGIALVDSSATHPTASTLHSIFGAGLTGAVNLMPSVPFSIVDLEGSIILPPGAYASFYTSTASGAAGGHISFSWAEDPI